MGEQRIELDGGAYIVAWDEDAGTQRAYFASTGKWRDLTDDGLVDALRQRISDLEQERVESIEALKMSKGALAIEVGGRVNLAKSIVDTFGHTNAGDVARLRNELTKARELLESESARWNARIKLLENRAHRAHEVMIGVCDEELKG
jgi:hypothetical protein